MNKDVIYVEPEDDITDIILKIENSKERIIALVPPKKAGVFRSIVNIKLIAKAGASAEKTVVLVTVDPSIVKLAAATKLPVTKDLQSAPTIPKLGAEDGVEETEEDELVEESDGTVETVEDVEELKPSKAEKKAEMKAEEEEEESEDTDDTDDTDSKKAKKPSKKTKGDAEKSMKLSGNKFLDWFKVHKKTTIFGSIALVGIIAFLVWAIGFAPAVDITVAIKTDQKNFSENISFTSNLSEEDAKEGKFYLEPKKIESIQEVDFEATGKKNLGEKATGDVVVYTYFRSDGSVTVNKGATFTVDGLSYVATESVSLSWDGDDGKACDNAGQASSLVQSGCQISERVDVVAAESGEKYNIAATKAGWSTLAPVSVYSDKPMAGGTDEVVTVVQQSDVEKAKASLTTTKESENKTKLYETIGDEYYIIDASFEQTTSTAIATPAVDEEVKDGVKPNLKATTTTSVYVIDKVKLEEFIRAKASLEDDQKIYDIKDIYISNFAEVSNNATAKLKAQYYIGPKITEAEVVEKIKGRGLGDAQREIRDIYGVSDVKMDPSYPWVMTVPGDSNKVTITFEVKDQSGNEIKEKTSEDSGAKDDENDKSTDKE